MLTLKQGIKLSAIIDKLDLKIDFKRLKDEKGKISQEEFGGELVMQLVSKVHRAEKEIYAFAAEIKKCTIEEAEELDLVKFFTEDLISDPAAVNFFKSAVKSRVQESSNSFAAPMT